MECPVCFNHTKTITDCNHPLCRACFLKIPTNYEWIQDIELMAKTCKRLCPICRQTITTVGKKVKNKYNKNYVSVEMWKSKFWTMQTQMKRIKTAHLNDYIWSFEFECIIMRKYNSLSFIQSEIAKNMTNKYVLDYNMEWFFEQMFKIYLPIIYKNEQN